LLTRPESEELAAAREDKTALLDLARREGMLSADGEPDEEQVALALHLLLAASPSRVVLAALADGVGDLRQPNLPGTTDEYPNWRLPLADPDGRPVPLEEAKVQPRLLRLADRLRAAVTES
jgi:4-alpha-glucanotransferase